MKTLHARNCSFNATDTPDGDFCDCVPVVEMSVKDYNAMHGRLTRLEAAVRATLLWMKDETGDNELHSEEVIARLEHALADTEE